MMQTVNAAGEPQQKAVEAMDYTLCALKVLQWPAALSSRLLKPDLIVMPGCAQAECVPQLWRSQAAGRPAIEVFFLARQHSVERGRACRSRCASTLWCRW